MGRPRNTIQRENRGSALNVDFLRRILRGPEAGNKGFRRGRRHPYLGVPRTGRSLPASNEAPCGYGKISAIPASILAADLNTCFSGWWGPCLDDDAGSSAICLRDDVQTQDPDDHNFIVPDLNQPDDPIFAGVSMRSREATPVLNQTGVSDQSNKDARRWAHVETLLNKKTDNKAGMQELENPAEEAVGSRHVRFACPFYRLNSVKYGECGKYTLQDPRYVKQHLVRAHFSPKIHCPVCGKDWPPERRVELISHIRRQSCETRDFKSFGILREHQKQSVLDLKSRKGEADPETMWFRMWDLLFPDVARPKANLVYMGDTVTEALLVVETAIGQKGDAVFSSLPPRRLEGRNSVQDTVLAALGRLHRTWHESKPVLDEWGHTKAWQETSGPDSYAMFAPALTPSLTYGSSSTASTTTDGDDVLCVPAYDDLFMATCGSYAYSSVSSIQSHAAAGPWIAPLFEGSSISTVYSEPDIDISMDPSLESPVID